MSAASPPLGPRARLAMAIADAVRSVPGARLSAGSGVAVATQYRGGRVLGVSLTGEEVTVQIVAAAVPLPPLLEALHRTVAAAMERAGDIRTVHVHVADVDLGGPEGQPES